MITPIDAMCCHKEILVPSDYGAAQMTWAAQRSELWNAAERAESRANARVAREYLVALPVELDADKRVELARGFSQELSDRYRFAVDLTVHARGIIRVAIREISTLTCWRRRGRPRPTV